MNGPFGWDPDAALSVIRTKGFSATTVDKLCSAAGVTKGAFFHQAAGKVSVGSASAEKPSGCVVWIGLSKETLELGPFMWFGGSPGKPLPDISAHPNPKRATHNAEGVQPPRKNHYILPSAAFTKLDILDELIVRLFGEVSMA